MFLGEYEIKRNIGTKEARIIKYKVSQSYEKHKVITRLPISLAIYSSPFFCMRNYTNGGLFARSF